MNFPPLALCSLIGPLALAAAADAQSIIFNSLRPSALSGVVLTHDPSEVSSASETASPNNENFSQQGQRFNLAGSARHLTQIDVRFGSFGGGGIHPLRFDGICRIYDVAASGAPGTMLWESLANDITFAGTSATRETPFSFFPNLDVPNSIYLQVSEADIVYGTPAASTTTFGWGWLFSGSPTVGTAQGWAAQDSTTTSWITTGLSIPAPSSLLEARLTAVPTPTTAVVLAALPAFACRRRRPTTH